MFTSTVPNRFRKYSPEQNRFARKIFAGSSLIIVCLGEMLDLLCRWGLDSGLVVVIFITTVYLLLVFGLFFYVKNEWCYVLFKNFTVRGGGVVHT
jgi:hypothetical protein